MIYLGLAILMRVFDLTTTYFALSRFSPVNSKDFASVEANPISRYGIEQLGWWQFAATNLIVSCLLIYCVSKRKAVMIGLILVQLPVVILNAYLAWGKLI